MATGGNSSVSQAGTSGGLSAEQLRRMEENKRRAQEKLARRVGVQPVRSGPPLTGNSEVGPPPSKRRAIQSNSHDSHNMVRITTHAYIKGTTNGASTHADIEFSSYWSEHQNFQKIMDMAPPPPPPPITNKSLLVPLLPTCALHSLGTRLHTTHTHTFKCA